MKMLKIFNDSRLYIPFLLLVLFEIFMQSGLYQNFLRPDSYAYNVNRVRKIVLNSRIEPNVLVVGTSVPYQGINLPLINQLLKADKIIVQSAATEGALITTQYAITREILEKRPSIKTILFVADMGLAWKSTYEIDSVNRSMMAQFPRLESLNILNELGYNIQAKDYSFIFARSLTYQADIRDFIMNPLYRLKKISREEEAQSVLYPHVNDAVYSLAGLKVKSMQDCIGQATRKELVMDSKGMIRDATGMIVSDKHHQKAAVQTCGLGDFEMHQDIKNYEHSRSLFFRRLQAVYSYFHVKKKNIVTVFPPYSHIIKGFNSKKKFDVWEKNLDRTCGSLKANCSVIDSRNSLDTRDNLSYYYDVLHLNKKGSIEWTIFIAEQIKKQKRFVAGN